MIEKTKAKTDLRVIKTRRNIEGAFLKLLEAHDFEQITVRMIVDEALVSRITFYNHYEDKYDLSRKITERHLNTIREGMMQRYQQVRSDGSWEHALGTFPAAMTEYQNIYRLLKKFPVEIIDIDEVMQQIVRDIISAAPLPVEVSKRTNELLPMIMSSLVLTYWKYTLTKKDPLPLSDYILAVQDLAAVYRSYAPDHQ